MTSAHAAACAVFTETGLMLIRFGGVVPPQHEIALTRDDEPDAETTLKVPMPLNGLIGYVLKPRGPAHSINITIGSDGACWLAVQPVPATRTMIRQSMPEWAPLLRIINGWRLVLDQGPLEWDDIDQQAELAGEPGPARQRLNELLATETLRVINGILEMEDV